MDIKITKITKFYWSYNLSLVSVDNTQKHKSYLIFCPLSLKEAHVVPFLFMLSNHPPFAQTNGEPTATSEVF